MNLSNTKLGEDGRLQLKVEVLVEALTIVVESNMKYQNQ